MIWAIYGVGTPCAQWHSFSYEVVGICGGINLQLKCYISILAELHITNYN